MWPFKKKKKENLDSPPLPLGITLLPETESDLQEVMKLFDELLKMDMTEDQREYVEKVKRFYAKRKGLL